MDDQSRKEVLGEVLMGELKAIREYVQDIPAIKKSVNQLEVDMVEVKSDVKVIKAVVQEHDKEIKQLKRQIA